MSGKTALVTGAAGFIGRHMVHHLSNRGYDVTGVDVSPLVNKVDARIAYTHDVLKFFGEHNDERPFDLLVHAAAAGANRVAIDTQPMNFSYNMSLDLAMFDYANRTRVGKVVYLSSSAVYPRVKQYASAGLLFENDATVDEVNTVQAPFDLYGHAKLIGERVARSLHEQVSTVIVRPFSGYGPDQSTDFPFNALIERTIAADDGDQVEVWGRWDQRRDFVHVDDVCRAILALVDAGEHGPVNICTGIGTSLGNIPRMAAQMLGKTVRPVSTEDRPQGVVDRVGSPALLHHHYQPRISLAQGIAERLGVS